MVIVKDKSDFYQAMSAPNCKITQEVVDKLCLWIRKGNYIKTACEAVGISRETFYRWARNAERGEEPYKSFMTELKRNESLGHVEDICSIHDDKSWVAKMTLRSRRHPELWQEVSRVQHEHELAPELQSYHSESADHVKRLRQAGVIPGEYRELTSGEDQAGEET